MKIGGFVLKELLYLRNKFKTTAVLSILESAYMKKLKLIIVDS